MNAPEAVLEHIADGAHVIVGVGNGEPVRVLDAIASTRSSSARGSSTSSRRAS